MGTGGGGRPDYLPPSSSLIILVTRTAPWGTDCTLGSATPASGGEAISSELEAPNPKYPGSLKKRSEICCLQSPGVWVLLTCANIPPGALLSEKKPNSRAKENVSLTFSIWIIRISFRPRGVGGRV